MKTISLFFAALLPLAASATCLDPQTNRPIPEAVCDSQGANHPTLKPAPIFFSVYAYATGNYDSLWDAWVTLKASIPSTMQIDNIQPVVHGAWVNGELRDYVWNYRWNSMPAGQWYVTGTISQGPGYCESGWANRAFNERVDGVDHSWYWCEKTN